MFCELPIVPVQPDYTIAAYDADDGEFLWSFRGGQAIPVGDAVWATTSPLARLDAAGNVTHTQMILGDGVARLLGGTRVSNGLDDLYCLSGDVTYAISGNGGIYAHAFDSAGPDAGRLLSTDALTATAAKLRGTVDDAYVFRPSEIHRLSDGATQAVSSVVLSSGIAQQNFYRSGLQVAVHPQTGLFVHRVSGGLRIAAFGAAGTVTTDLPFAATPQHFAVDSMDRVYWFQRTAFGPTAVTIHRHDPPSYDAAATISAVSTTFDFLCLEDDGLLLLSQSGLRRLDAAGATVWTTAALFGVSVCACGADWILVHADGMSRIDGSDGSEIWRRTFVFGGGPGYRHITYHAPMNQIVATTESLVPTQLRFAKTTG